MQSIRDSHNEYKIRRSTSLAKDRYSYFCNYYSGSKDEISIVFWSLQHRNSGVNNNNVMFLHITLRFITFCLFPIDYSEMFDYKFAIILFQLSNTKFSIGIISGGCGDLAIRLRPALTFQEHHADIFLDKFRQVLKETK